MEVNAPATGTDPFEISSLHLSSVGKALKDAGIHDAAIGSLQPATRAALDEPNLQRWFAGSIVEDVWQTVATHFGFEKLAEINYRVAKQSFGPVVMPVIKVALALSGSSPASVAGRLESMLKLAIREVKIVWAASGANGGTITITYPRPVVAVAEHAWRGVFRFMFEITGRQGGIDRVEVLEGGSQFRFAVRWT